MCSKGPPVGMVPHKSLLDTSLRKMMTTEDMFLGNSIVGRGLKTSASENSNRDSSKQAKES